jgi:hypothetical protein
MRTYIQQPGQVGVQGGTIGNAGYLAQMPPAINPAAHRGAQKGAKIYNKGVNTENPYEKKTFLDRTGPQLPPMARLGPMDNTNLNMGQINDAYLQEQERQRLLQEQQAQAELNNSMYGGGQYGQADQYPATGAGFQAKYVS